MLAKQVRNTIDSGLYNDASEVVREALRLMIERESGNGWLRREAVQGFAQLDAGGYQELNRAQFMKRFGKKRRAA